MLGGAQESLRCCGIQLRKIALDYPFYGNRSTHTESYRLLSNSLRCVEIIFKAISYIDKQQAVCTPTPYHRTVRGLSKVKHD